MSIDHLIVTATEHQKRERYQLTIHNAEEFLVEHRKRGLAWTPIGAVQGWDARSYAEAARQYVAMGYPYIALGGLVRTSTVEILRVLEEVHQVVPEHVPMHLFGLARIKALNDFARLGVRSVDSASFLRRAWMGTGQNYLTADGQLYAAIRIPRAEKSFRAKRMVSEGRADFEWVKRLEQACFQSLLAYDRGGVRARNRVPGPVQIARLAGHRNARSSGPRTAGFGGTGGNIGRCACRFRGWMRGFSRWLKSDCCRRRAR